MPSLARRFLPVTRRPTTPVIVKGWVRTRRDSKAGISFVHVSDGSCFHPVQAVVPNTLAELRRRRRAPHGGMRGRDHRQRRALAGERPAVRVAGEPRRRCRLRRGPRYVSDPAQAAHARIPARGGAPAAAHERHRRRHARARFDRACDAPLLPRQRVLLDQHADHHHVGRRRRRRDVPRVDARPRQPAAHGRRTASTTRRTSSAAKPS